MSGLGLSTLFGLVGFLLSYGIFVPADLKFFSLIAAAGAMCGHALGKQVTQLVKTPISNVALTIVFLFTCVSCTVAYAIYIQRAGGEANEIILLAMLLLLIFFSFAFLIPLTGTFVGKIARQD